MLTLFGPWSPHHDIQSPQLGASEIYALAHLSGNAPRVWFFGPGAQARQHWIRRARSVWLKDVQSWGQRAQLGEIAEPSLIASILAEAAHAGPAPQWGPLAAEFVTLFGRDLKKALDLVSVVTGYPHPNIADHVFGITWNAQHYAEARTTRRSEAISLAQTSLQHAQRSAWPSQKSYPSYVDLPKAAEVTDRKLTRAARSFLDDFRFSELHIDGALEPAQALRVLLGARRSLQWISDFTKLPWAAMGLGGWSLRLAVAPVIPPRDGTALRGHTAAEVNPVNRTISLSREGGHFALAHEWMHAFDATLAQHTKLPFTYASESSTLAASRLPLRSQHFACQESSTLLHALLQDEPRWTHRTCTPHLRLAEIIADLFVAATPRSQDAPADVDPFIVQQAYLLGLFLEGLPYQEACKLQKHILSQWRKHCLQVAPWVSSTRRALELAYTRSVAALRWKKLLRSQCALKATRPSHFAIQSIIDDIMRHQILGLPAYFSEPTETLARAFEACMQSYACHHMECELIPVEMHSDISHTSASAPQGRELLRAQQAFEHYFKQTAPLLQTLTSSF